MNHRLDPGTHVKVTDGAHDGVRGLVLRRLTSDTYLVYLDDGRDTLQRVCRGQLDVHVPPVSERIIDRDKLIGLKLALGVRDDWHEPDERDVTVEVRGRTFDNAGFWDDDHAGRGSDGKDHEELHVAVLRDGEQVATVNLATLFAWATGYDA